MNTDKALQNFLDNVKDSFGDESLATISGNVQALSTGSLSLDISTGIGGIPRGRFTELYGSEGTGKTTLALSISKSVVVGGGKVLYVDTENTLDYGLVREIIPESTDSNFIISNPLTLDSAFKIMLSGIESGLFELVVMDSLPALPSEEEVEKGLDRDTMMVLPRKAGQFLRLSAVKVRNNNTTVLIVNQVRDNTTSYFGGFKTPGGHALKHFNTLEIALNKGKAIEDDDSQGNKQRIGTYTQFTIKKNKVGIPFRSAELPIIYGKGVDYYRDVIEFSALLGVTRKKGSYIYYGDVNIGQGMKRATEKLRTDPELLKAIETDCYDRVSGVLTKE